MIDNTVIIKNLKDKIINGLIKKLQKPEKLTTKELLELSQTIQNLEIMGDIPDDILRKG